MIIELYRPEGKIKVDTATVTDDELMLLNIPRANLTRMIPRDILKELDELKADVAILRGV